MKMPPHAGTTPTNSTSQLPLYQPVLLSISGDSKISLQHTSVQQLSTIPEGKVLDETSSILTNGSRPPTGQGGGGGHQDDQDSLAPGGPVQPMLIDDDQFDEPHVLVQDPAPDGGYGWVIVLSSFLCNLIVDGIAYTFGLFFEIFVAHFATSKSKVALCGALLNGCYLGVGPIVSSLANRYGCRFVTILGAIIACIALVLSTSAPNIETLMVTYGVIGGVGFGMIYLPAIVSVGYYFTTKRAFATGVAVCGSGVGTFLFAPFCQYLLSVTSWQNTLFILAFMVLSCSAFGALMRPLDIHAEAVLDDEEDEDELVVDEASGEVRKPLLQRIAEEKRRRLLAHSNSQFLLMMQNGSIDVHDPAYNDLKTRLMLNTEPGVHSTLYLDQLFGQHQASQSPVPNSTTPSPTPTPSVYYPSSSVNQSLMTLEKHQLSPIMEKKVVSCENLSDETLNQLTVTTVVEVDHHQKIQDVFKNYKEQQEDNNKPVDEKPDDAVVDRHSNQMFESTSLLDYASIVNGDDDDADRLTLKSAMTSPEKKDDAISGIYPSSITLPHSPTFEDATSASTAALAVALSGRGGGSGLSGSHNQVLRSRRSTMRSQNSGTDTSSLLHPGSAMLHPGASPTNMSMSMAGQIPVQVILSTPNHQTKDLTDGDGKEGKDAAAVKRNNSTQTIHVRPLYKKDIFYSGSTQHIPHSQLSLSHQCHSAAHSIGQSLVSIPARDIIEKVQRQIQQREQEAEEAAAAAAFEAAGGQNGMLRQQRNFCNKIVKIICPFKTDDLDCYRKSKHNLEESKQLQLVQHKQGQDEEDPELGDQEDELDGQSHPVKQLDEEEEAPARSCWGKLRAKLPPSMGSILNEMLDLSLLRDSSAFTILAISNVFGMMGFYVPFVYITQFAVSSVKDGDGFMSKESAALLISVIGITNTLGRLLFGYISDRIARNGTFAGIRMTALGLNNVCVLLAGIMVVAIPYCTTYLTIMIDCVLFGLFISAYICLTSIILVDMLGLDKLTNAFGLLCLFRGAASMLGPPLAGALFDWTESYKITFAASGLLLIFASLMAFFITIREHTVDQDPDNECDTVA